MRRIYALARRLLAALLARLPARQLECVLAETAARRVRRLPPADGLKLLFGLDARLYPILGQLSVAYDDGIHTKHRHMGYHDFFTERVSDGESVLDIGCGIGALASDIVLKSGARVLGVDRDASSLRVAGRRFSHPNLRYIQIDAQLALPAEHYDVIVLSNVLEHLEERVEFLRRAQAVVTPQRWLIRVPAFDRDWRVPLKKELGIEWRLDPTHCIEYTRESFTDELSQAGLEITYMERRWGEIWAEARPAEHGRLRVAAPARENG
jgi:SAM-dependent methyltransferase